ncbi:hypothetical protein CH254_04320 [Rhodococcus sp. 06-412-2C]|nr:hypothetical protein CH254_04320 [Rhodococcus sp. 06-412-2C]OZC92281.1 hypothetical protein CH279_25595 [Rhodococcus sp. 06-412-2B]OZE77348.1 hypothetical protein CH305_19260 [Rhodococcus sp. 15-649-2-2]
MPLAELSIFGYIVLGFIVIVGYIARGVTRAVFALIRLSGSAGESEHRSSSELTCVLVHITMNTICNSDNCTNLMP